MWWKIWLFAEPLCNPSTEIRHQMMLPHYAALSFNHRLLVHLVDYSAYCRKTKPSSSHLLIVWSETHNSDMVTYSAACDQNLSQSNFFAGLKIAMEGKYDIHCRRLSKDVKADNFTGDVWCLDISLFSPHSTRSQPNNSVLLVLF